MNRRFAVLQHFSRRHNFGICNLLECWIVGMLSGISFAFFTDSAGNNLYYGWCYETSSIVHLLASCLFPFLLSVMTITLFEHWALCPILAVKAFSLGFCGCLICRCFGSAGWLVCALLLFTGWGSSIPLLWFCVAALKDRCRALSRIPWILTMDLIIVLFDLYFISPILGDALHG